MLVHFISALTIKKKHVKMIEIRKCQLLCDMTWPWEFKHTPIRFILALTIKVMSKWLKFAKTTIANFFVTRVQLDVMRNQSHTNTFYTCVSHKSNVKIILKSNKHFSVTRIQLDVMRNQTHTNTRYNLTK